MMELISSLMIPLVILLLAALMLAPRKAYFEEFTLGAADGLRTSVNLLPSMIALMVSLSMFSASGAVEVLTRVLAPVGEKIGVPVELLPLLITRPFSGSASTATYTELIERYGADSFAGLCASTIMGSSDTLVYVMAVYFSSVAVKRTRYAFGASFFIMLFCILLSCIVCRFFFGG